MNERKVIVSITLDRERLAMLDRLASEFTGGNRSKAVENLIPHGFIFFAPSGTYTNLNSNENITEVITPTPTA